MKLLKLAGIVLGVALVTVLGVRIVDTQRGPPLELWHTVVPDELDARELAATDWAGHLAAEERAFAQVRENVIPRPSPTRARSAPTSVECVVEAGQMGETVRELGLEYPGDVHSLSHLALTFPLSDSLYGLKPEPGAFFGAHLSVLAARGDRGILRFSMDSMLRMSPNPFCPYLLERIEDGIVARR